MSGQLTNNPLMSTFNQMMAGKDQNKQFQTLLNIAKSKGINIDEKMFSESDLRQLGLIK